MGHKTLTNIGEITKNSLESALSTLVGLGYYVTAPVMGSLNSSLRERIYSKLLGKEDAGFYGRNQAIVEGVPFYSSLFLSPLSYGGFALTTTGNEALAIGLTLYGLLESSLRFSFNEETGERKGNLPLSIMGKIGESIYDFIKK